MKKGEKMSDELKLKISNANSGKIHSVEFREACRQRRLGKKHSEKTRKKMSVTHTGVKKSLKHRISISLAKRGSNSSFWRGGKTELIKLLRKTSRYQMWRTEVFKRDNYTCQECGTRGRKGCHVDLEADHFPKQFCDLIRHYKITTYEDADSCDELWRISLGRALCVSCHRKTPTYGKKIEYYTTKI